MDINLFTLCDYADQLGGKEVVIGTFDAVHAPQVPFVLQSCAIATGMRVLAAESGTHSVHFQILSPDGKPVIPKIGGNISIQVPPSVESIGANFNVKLARIKFDSYGRHSVVLSVDGQDLRTAPLFIVRSHIVPPSEKVVSE
jgi:hypothetical protein